ncbi:MAG: O-antigen ligase family protein [Kutzneria sp.]|nr:O-antigen ligase family protein [Kutzneria sp.]
MTMAVSPSVAATGTSSAASVLRISPQVVIGAYLLMLALPQNNVLAGGGGAITPARLIAGLCLLWWLVARYAGGFGLSAKGNPIRRVLLLAPAAFMVADITAFVGGVDDSRIAGADRALMLFVLAVATGLLLCDAVQDARSLRIVFGAAVIGFSCSAFAAVLQFLTSVDLRPFTVLPGLVTQDLGPIDLARDGLQRSIGFANHPIELAASSVAMLPLAMHLARHARFRPFWWCCTAVLVCGPLVSISRTGLLGIAVVGLLLLPRCGLARWLLSAALLGSAVLLAGTVEPRLIDALVNTVLGASKDSSIWSRLTKYDYVWTHLLERPLGGQGFGTYVTPVQPFLDNQYLLTAVESGLLGLVGFVALLAVPTWLMFKVWRGRPASVTPVVRDAAWAVAGALLVCVISFGTYDGFAFPQFAGVTVVLVGAGGCVLAMARETGAHR